MKLKLSKPRKKRVKRNPMDATLQADLQAVADKDNATFDVTVTPPPVPPTETVHFSPTAPV